MVATLRYFYYFSVYYLQIHILISFLFCFLLLDLLEFFHQLSPLCKTLKVYPFLIHNEMNDPQFKPKGQLFELVHSYKLVLISVISLSAHKQSYPFILFLSSALHTRCQQLFKYFQYFRPCIP